MATRPGQILLVELGWRDTAAGLGARGHGANDGGVTLAAALAALRLFEVGELQARVEAIEAALHQTGAAPEATADAELLRLLRRAS